MNEWIIYFSYFKSQECGNVYIYISIFNLICSLFTLLSADVLGWWCSYSMKLDYEYSNPTTCFCFRDPFYLCVIVMDETVSNRNIFGTFVNQELDEEIIISVKLGILTIVTRTPEDYCCLFKTTSTFTVWMIIPSINQISYRKNMKQWFMS